MALKISRIVHFAGRPRFGGAGSSGAITAIRHPSGRFRIAGLAAMLPSVVGVYMLRPDQVSQPSGNTSVQRSSKMFAKAICAVVITFVCLFTASQVSAAERLTVMMSGGFAHVYNAVLPDFERTSGISVTTLSGASQGTGPKTIKSQLEHGVEADVVILSGEGLSELIAAGLIAPGSQVPLAKTPLAAAVREGRPKPNIGDIASFKQALIDARLVAMPGSTSGIFVRDTVFPKLGVADKVSLKLVARGLESTAMLAAGEANMALGPASELLDQPGIEFVGLLPDDLQLLQVFTAATTKTSRRSAEGKRLTDFLTSGQTTAAIGKAGMQPAHPASR